MTPASFFVQLLNGLAGASSLFLVAAGLTLIFGVSRIVNFAHGSLYMLGAYVAWSFAAWQGPGPLGFWGGVAVAVVAVAAIGAAIERMLLRRIYAAPELLQLAATFGVVLIIRDAALALWGAEDLLGPRAPGFAGVIDFFGRPVPTYDLLLIAVGPLVLGGLWALVTHTRFGVLIRAATENRALAGALGIDEARLFTAVFAVGDGLAGLAGALQLPREPANLGMDLAVIAEAFVVTVVGGLGSITGAFLAALLIGLTKAMPASCWGASTSGVTSDRVSEADAGRRVRRDGDRAGAAPVRPAGTRAGDAADDPDRRVPRAGAPAGATGRHGRARRARRCGTAAAHR